jgi:hypothetical protein
MSKKKLSFTTLSFLKNIDRVLAKVERDKLAFDIEILRDTYRSHTRLLADHPGQSNISPKCKTIACVAGHACVDLWFRERFNKGHVLRHLPFDAAYSKSPDTCNTLGLTLDEIRRLFYSGPEERYYGTSVRDVRKYVQKLIKKYAKDRTIRNVSIVTG